MIRLSLRQFRTEAVIGGGLLVVVAIVLAVTGPHLVDTYRACIAGHGSASGCANALGPVEPQLQIALPLLVLVAPTLVGLFFGAPLIARELETGTYRLAWTQSVTRSRWLAIKLAVVGVAAVVLCEVLTLITDWWASPLDLANANRFSPASFGLHGVVPIGYAAFGFTLGVTTGVVLRRTVPAMVVTLVGYIGARLAVTYWIRPRLANPLRIVTPLASSQGIGLSRTVSGGSAAWAVVPSAPQIPNALIVSSAAVNAAGLSPTSAQIVAACPNLPTGVPVGAAIGPARAVQRVGPGPGGPGVFQNCINALGRTLHVVTTYQPGSRFWPFQWAEMAIFLALALLLAGVSMWSVRRRLS